MADKVKAEVFVKKAVDIATKYKTLYIMGCFGAPMNNTNKRRYTNNHVYNKRIDRTRKILNTTSNTFGFDCVCLIKGILWGWSGNTSRTYGGAKYLANGVADIGANTMITSKYCDNVSTDFSKIEKGEVVWMEGHVGIYIGDGLVVECTPIWKDGVQITGIRNVKEKKGYNNRTWKKHAKLKYIDYTKQEEPILEPTSTPSIISSGKLSIGTKVKIIKRGNGSSYGTSNSAGGIGSVKYITKVYAGRPFPYQVGNKGKTDGANTMGFYKETALKKV